VVPGRYEEAESYFEQAAELNTRGEMRFAEAETNLYLGRMLRARNKSGDAVGPATSLSKPGRAPSCRSCPDARPNFVNQRSVLGRPELPGTAMVSDAPRRPNSGPHRSGSSIAIHLNRDHSVLVRTPPMSSHIKAEWCDK
jgi:hypothetical protein